MPKLCGIFGRPLEPAAPSVSAVDEAASSATTKPKADEGFAVGLTLSLLAVVFSVILVETGGETIELSDFEEEP